MVKCRCCDYQSESYRDLVNHVKDKHSKFDISLSKYKKELEKCRKDGRKVTE